MAATGAGERRRADLGDDRGDDPPARRRPLPGRRRVRGGPAVRGPPLRAARAPRPPRALGGGDRAARGAGADRARAGGAPGGVRRRRGAASTRAHPRGPPDPADREAPGAGRQHPAGHRHLLAQRDPHGRQVDLLRGQHAGDPDRPGPGRRRGLAGEARRHRAGGANLDDVLGLAGGGASDAHRSDPASSSRSPARRSGACSTSRRASSVSRTCSAPARLFSPRPTREVQPVSAIDDRALETPGPRTLEAEAAFKQAVEQALGASQPTA